MEMASELSVNGSAFQSVTEINGPLALSRHARKVKDAVVDDVSTWKYSLRRSVISLSLRSAGLSGKHRLLKVA